MHVLLAYLPFGIVQYPHLGIGLLKASLTQAGIPCEAPPLALEFADRIGRDVYGQVAGLGSAILLGERLFARAVNDGIPDLAVFYRDIVRPGVRGLHNALALNRPTFERHLAMSREVERQGLSWLEEVAARDFGRFGLFGFSTSYEQTAASLGLARRLRARYPTTPVVWGGANCTGDMGTGLLRAFDFIDYVCTGEGERCLVQLVRWLEDPDRHPFPEKGIVSRQMLQDGSHRATQPDQVPDLDSLPLPDYSEYFEALRARPGWQKHFFALPMEGARGCWKANSDTCLFCGLNGVRNLYRAKTPARYCSEVTELCRRYRVKYVMATDNILSPVLLRKAFPVLAQDPPYEALWQEVRVGLTAAELKVLRAARARYLGVGLESLSSRLLGVMRKGVTALQNVHFLRLATELGFDVTWHILCGLPGETEEDYRTMASLMGRLHHLIPPKQLARITIDRHSPLYAEAADFGLELEPGRAYRYIFQLTSEALAGISYVFQDRRTWKDRVAGIGPPSLAWAAQEAVRAWQAAWPRARLAVIEEAGRLRVVDERESPARSHDCSELEREIIVATAEPRTRDALREHVAQGRARIATAEFDAALAGLVNTGLLVQEADEYLFVGVDYAVREAMLAGDRDRFFIRVVQEGREYAYDG